MALLGIDLGTTNSLVAVFQDGAPRLIPNAMGEVLTPSIVGVLDDDRVLVGAAARELRVTRPERCAASFKRWMGTDREVTLGRHKFSPSELSSLVLRSLRADAEAFLGAPPTEAVITVPAYFNDHQRKATKIAGELAGFAVRRIINEPTAAALTYGFHDRHANRRLLVFDLGGGTFDVTLMQTFEGTLEIAATSGESQLGGEDFTERLMGWALRQHGLLLETAEMREPLRVARLRQEAEHAKRALTANESSTFRMPDGRGEFASDAPIVHVTREIFGTQCAELLRRLEPPVRRVLRDASLGPEAVDEVILVGGATRMPIVHETVARLFSKQPLVTFDPDHVVALGAAVQAALITDDAAVGDMVMTDVCPFTLGVEIVKVFGQQRRDGYFMPIIHRNTTIPVSCEEIVSTLDANQREITVRVFQGDARRVEDNLPLGELRVTGIPPGPAGTEIHVRFTYDLNGILEVEAFVPSAGKKFQTVLTQHVKGLNSPQIALAVQKLQSLKFYPRDELPNRQLVLFVERILGELNRYQREAIEQLLDGFEQSMATGDRERFAAAREQLLIGLSGCGYPYTMAGGSGGDGAR
ncbi:MAG: Hsp70 family protein [Planctomycetota bacterium]